MPQVNITSSTRPDSVGHSVHSTPLVLSDLDAGRFWALVDRGAPDACWLWRGALAGKHGYRYGRFGVLRDGRHAQFYAHRLAYELTHGPLADGLVTCHRCDITKCCNPAHLFSGTEGDNMRDAAEKGHLKVARKRNRTVKPEAVQRYLAGGVTAKELGAEYGISFMTVHRWIREATNGTDQRVRNSNKRGPYKRREVA